MSASTTTINIDPAEAGRSEAEVLVNELMDLGLTPAVDVTDDRLYFTFDAAFAARPDPIALRTAGMLFEAFHEDEALRDEAVAYITNVGELLVPAPGFLQDLQTAGPVEVVAALLFAGLNPILLLNDNHVTKGLTFTTLFDRPAGNAHLLIDLIQTRFWKEHDFYTGLYAYLSSTGSSLYVRREPAAA